MMTRQEWTRCASQRIRLPVLLMLVGLAGSTRPLVAPEEDPTLRVPKSGIYVIWYPSKGNAADLYLNQPYVVGISVSQDDSRLASELQCLRDRAHLCSGQVSFT